MSTSSHPAFVANMLRLLSNWCTWFPYDYQEEAVMARMRKLSTLCVTWDPSVQGKVSQLLQSLLRHLSAVERHATYLAKIARLQVEAQDSGRPPLDPVLLPGAAPPMVAQQLTHIELQVKRANKLVTGLSQFLSFIGPDEFVNAFARDYSSKKKQGTVEEEEDAR